MSESLGPYRKTEITDIKEPQVGEGQDAPTTVMAVFKNTVAKFGERNALNVEKGEGDDRHWVRYTWKEYYDETFKFAKSLIALDVAAFSAVNIIGFNSPEWHMANCGAIAAGCIPAGIYTTNGPDACKYVSNHCDAKVVVVEDQKQLAKYSQICADLSLKALVVYNDVLPENTTNFNCPVYTWKDFLALGAKVSDQQVEDRITPQKPGNCCTLIYTSGTTGNPKAVMISHDNLTWTAKATEKKWNGLSPDDRVVGYLPLSHIAAQMLDIHAPMCCGCQVHFARPDALKGSIALTLRAVQPTIFFGVPRVWEKFMEKALEIGKSAPYLLASFSAWAKSLGLEKSKGDQYGAAAQTPCGFSIANIVYKKAAAAFGLSSCRLRATGAAPIARETLDYFSSLNMPIYELFGQSECTGPHTVNTPDMWKVGTTGTHLAGCETKIQESDGEICYRGRHIFMGYLKMPEKTLESIDAEGWLHSGDIGVLDADGFLSITGRIKELIITAGGENIPPVLIENDMKAVMPCISNCMLIGDAKKFLSLLVCLKVEIDADTGIPSNVLMAAARECVPASSAKTTEEAMKCEHWTAYLNAGCTSVNKTATSKAQCVQKWKILPTDFSIPGGELGPTLKLKRPVVSSKFVEEIEAFYA